MTPEQGQRLAAAELRRLVEVTGVDVPVHEGATAFLPPGGVPDATPAAPDPAPAAPDPAPAVPDPAPPAPDPAPTAPGAPDPAPAAPPLPDGRAPEPVSQVAAACAVVLDSLTEAVIRYEVAALAESAGSGSRSAAATEMLTAIEAARTAASSQGGLPSAAAP